ncbi:hypothetical protein P3S68_010751 [Capsicum galapagoense]
MFGNIESYYHIVAAVPLLGQPVVFFEIYSSQSNSWKCSSSDCLELEDTTVIGGGLYMKGVAYWNTTSNDVLAFDVKVEILNSQGQLNPQQRFIPYVNSLVTLHDELRN